MNKYDVYNLNLDKLEYYWVKYHADKIDPSMQHIDFLHRVKIENTELLNIKSKLLYIDNKIVSILNFNICTNEVTIKSPCGWTNTFTIRN